jgi:hypothetical protein
MKPVRALKEPARMRHSVGHEAAAARTQSREQQHQSGHQTTSPGTGNKVIEKPTQGVAGGFGLAFIHQPRRIAGGR